MSSVEKSSPSPVPREAMRQHDTYGPLGEPAIGRPEDAVDTKVGRNTDAPIAAAPASIPKPMPPGQPVEPPLLARLHTLRRAAGKVSRKMKRVLGRPDASPWILRPPTAHRSTAFVDVLVALDYLSPNSTLVGLLHEALAPRGLSLLLVNDRNVENVIAQLNTGWLKPHVTLDLCSAANARYFDLLHSADAAGAYTVGNPHRLLDWTLKSNSHPRLQRAGLPLPPTVFLKHGEADRDLTPQELSAIGERCVIKPAWGVGGLGAVINVEPTRAAIAAARDYNRQDDWLVQKMIRWARCGNRPAYLRGYSIFGHRTLLWWSKENGFDRYAPLTWDDLQTYDLLPAVDLVDRIASLSGLDFFSTEIAITAESGPDRFCLIDYVNDQCDMDPDPRPGTSPVPLEWSKWVCGRFAEFAWRKKEGLPGENQMTLTLA